MPTVKPLAAVLRGGRNWSYHRKQSLVVY
ncbi:uncharacterized protein METZ01_LOCUS87242 [marine metagenome]|uniref:Uncharacterized protein n=1 Tax=marine metagenome TaxID=408172 RepID=A0A381V3M8_9ZZZZ